MHISLLITLLPAVALTAPLLKVKRQDVIPGKYIVKLKGEFGTFTETISTTPDVQFSMPGFRGFAGTLTQEEVAKLQASSQVDFIEEDAKVYASALVTQSGAPWGLGRISHRTPGSTNYVYDDSAGAGTCSYVIDTGIETSHPEFEGRASFLVDTTGEGAFDGNGHGTHVAGTIGSRSYGVAKKTRLIAVKVLTSDGSGSTSSILTGIDAALGDANARKADGTCPNGVTANMSLGGGRSSALNAGSRSLAQSGVFLAVASGNSNIDANQVSPASEPSVCTVSATTIDDKLASFSNWGSVVDILAPGVDVLSTWLNGGTNVISGTSMASPHVAGLGAYLLGLGAQVGPLCAQIAGTATQGAIDPASIRGSTVNRLAYNGAT